MNEEFETVLAALTRETDVLDADQLAALSDLDASELAQFWQTWHALSNNRRQELLVAMIELGNEFIELDFREVFCANLGDQDPACRVLAVEGLWEDERPQRAYDFITLLTQDAHTEVRAVAALALGRFIILGELEEMSPEATAAVTEALWNTLQAAHEPIEVKSRALESLGASSDSRIPHAIEEALYDEDIRMQASALHAMGRSADRRWIPTLLPQLRASETSIRLQAVKALGELEARSAVPYLIQLMNYEGDGDVLLAAVAALGMIGGKEAQKALEIALEWDDDQVVIAAEEALDILLLSDGSTYELINEVLGIDDPDMDMDLDFADYDEDPLEAEIRRLLDEMDDL